MLDLSNLRHFLALAQHQNLASAADALSLTPSAVSKSIKRLEDALRTVLFDREGRGMRLNADGKRLVERAMPLVSAAEQLQAEFAGQRHAIKCRIAGPALLHLGWGQSLADVLTRRYPLASIAFEQCGDEAAIAAVLSGESDVALVTMSQERSLDARLQAIPLGTTEFRVAVGADHALSTRVDGPPVPIGELLAHDFAVPQTPPFASLNNQCATDGWRDDVFARNIRYRSDNLLIVQHLLQQGKALAYLPDSAIAALQLRILAVTGCPYRCVQSVALVFRQTMGIGWIGYLADHCATAAPSPL